MYLIFSKKIGPSVCQFGSIHLHASNLNWQNEESVWKMFGYSGMDGATSYIMNVSLAVFDLCFLERLCSVWGSLTSQVSRFIGIWLYNNKPPPEVGATEQCNHSRNCCHSCWDVSSCDEGCREETWVVHSKLWISPWRLYFLQISHLYWNGK